MLFTAIPLALLGTEPWLLEQPHETLLASGLALMAAQAVRGVALGSDAYSAFLMGLLSLLLVPVMSIVLVLFGAPVITVQVETLLCGLVLSALVLQPLLTQYGLDGETWRTILSFEAPKSGVYLGSVGGAVGAWLGAVPIALDWDRPWQAYPITIVLGAYLGSAVGGVIGRFTEPKKSRPTKHKAKKE